MLSVCRLLKGYTDLTETECLNQIPSCGAPPINYLSLLSLKSNFIIMSEYECLAISVSVFAAVVAALSAWYCYRNFRMNRYEFHNRRLKEKQAAITASVAYQGSGSYIVTFTNTGLAVAWNVDYDFLDKPIPDGMNICTPGVTPFHILDAGSSFHIRFSCDYRRPDYTDILIKWEDAYSFLNERRVTLCFAH